MVDKSKSRAQSEMILDAAHKKFMRFGVRRVNMAELAGELRISKKTIYRYYDGKEALVRACIDRILNEKGPQMVAALEGKGSVKERIFEHWQILLTLPQMISTEFLADMKADYPHIWEEVDAYRHGIFNHYEALIGEGIASGEVHSGTHPKVFVRILFAILEKVATPDVFALGEFMPSDVFETIFSLLSNGLFVDQELRGEGKE